MISVIIPTINAEATLTATLAPLVPAAVDGLVREVIVVDGGSTDGTRSIADEAGAKVISSACGRGAQLAAGAKAARFPWLLFLHADTVLEQSWDHEAGRLIKYDGGHGSARKAGVFKFALDDHGFQPRLLEKLVRLRTRLLALPYGDQGLLISRKLYDEVGGYRDMPMMEDVDIVWRLGRRHIELLNARAMTSAVRYRRDGYLRRSTRNVLCLTLYAVGVHPRTIARIYG